MVTASVALWSQASSGKSPLDIARQYARPDAARRLRELGGVAHRTAPSGMAAAPSTWLQPFCIGGPRTRGRCPVHPGEQDSARAAAPLMMAAGKEPQESGNVQHGQTCPARCSQCGCPPLLRPACWRTAALRALERRLASWVPKRDGGGAPSKSPLPPLDLQERPGEALPEGSILIVLVVVVVVVVVVGILNKSIIIAAAAAAAITITTTTITPLLLLRRRHRSSTTAYTLPSLARWFSCSPSEDCREPISSTAATLGVLKVFIR